MKALRQFFVASVLILTLSLSAFAGDMTTGVASPQPTPARQGDIHTTRAGDISTMNADADAADDSLTDAALALIESLLSLF
jgi:hypothetical protein